MSSLATCIQCNSIHVS